MQLKSAFTQLQTIYSGLSLSRKIALFSVVAGVLGGFALILFLSGRPDYQVLFSGLSAEDSGAVIAQLKAKKIPYQVSSNGGAILVPKEKVYETRMELATAGLPQGGGVGFEIFDHSKLGMTEFVQNVNYLRALQGELTRTIDCFEEIESSRVHLVIPPKTLFVEDEEPARASVVIKFKPGKTLTSDQIQGIIHLISSSIAGLKPENVTLVDTYGNQIGEKKEKTEFERIRADQLAYQETVERNLERRVKTMLENALGPDKAIVRLSTSMDFKKQEKTEERFYPDDKVVRSEQLLNESTTNLNRTSAGIPGSNAAMAANNQQAQAAGAAANVAGASNTTATASTIPVNQKKNQTVNYEIGKVTSHTIEPIGQISRLSVAVLVNGTYKTVTDKNGKTSQQYVPRSPEEIDKIKNIVMRAVNYSSARGDAIEVANIPFENPGLMDAGNKSPGGGWISTLMQYSVYLKYLFSGIFMVLTFIFVIRPMIQWLTTDAPRNMDLLGSFPRTVNELEKEYGTGEGESASMSLPLADQLSQLALADNQAFIEVLREWMKQT